MIRTKRGVSTKRKHKKILTLASGYFGSRSKLFRIAKETVQRALCYSYRDRKTRKRFFRRLWIVRINAASKHYHTNYSSFICDIKKNNILLNRKILSFLAVFHANIIDIMIHISRTNET